MRGKWGLVCAAGAAWTLAAPAHAAANCDDLLPPAEVASPGEPVTAEVLARLRDAGPIYHYQTDRPILALSPDQRSVAFEIHRGDPADGSYCVGIAVQPLSGSNRPYLADVGSELIIDPSPARGFAAFESGAPLPITVRWDPRGRWMAFLKRVNGRTQVWRAAIDTRRAEPVTHSNIDIDDFRISSDGRTLIYASRPDLIQGVRAIDREGASGWHFDERWIPVRSARPALPDAPTVYTAVDLASLTERSASPGEQALFKKPMEVPKEAAASAQGRGGQLAWTQPVSREVYPPAFDIVAASRTGPHTTCKADICKASGSTQLWWSDDGTKLRFSRREGWAGSLTVIYEWRPGANSVRRLYETSDAVIECQPRGDDLLCLRERSAEPRHIVLFGLGSGREQTLFQTNPEISGMKLGRIERQNWKNASGVPFYGDLVYPADFVPGRRYPMVIVQYRTRGFLRGGVGDEMPVQAFAGRGYFVLVLDIGDEASIVGTKKSYLDQQSASYRDHFIVKEILSAAETITQSLIDRGLVEPRKVGISGLSAGARIVQFAAINSPMFSAGSMGSCCEEPDQDAFLGPAIAENYRKHGFPRLADQAPEFWRQMSIMTQPARVRFPLLVQAADKEYLASLGAVTAMAQAGVPADLFVFPDEYHIKWHPAHRLAVYNRNLAWFDFWLREDMPDDPAATSEALRWRAKRDAWHTDISPPR